MSRGTPIIEARAFRSGRAWVLSIDAPGMDHALMPSERFESYSEAREWFKTWLANRGGGTAILRNLSTEENQ